MFSFLWKKAFLKKAAFALSLVVAAGITLAACQLPTDSGISIPDKLIGTWASDYGEEYIITGTTFYSGMTGYGGYGGDIVNHRADGAATGYITIQYTKNDWNSDAIGNYYVIHYKELTASTMKISGASDSDGKPGRKEAETEYTLGNGSFGEYGYSDLVKEAA